MNPHELYTNTAAHALPPMSQSRRADMACELLYVHKHIRHIASGEANPAARGTAIHELLSTYINHLIATKRATDLELFDRLTQNVRDGARKVLPGSSYGLFSAWLLFSSCSCLPAINHL